MADLRNVLIENVAIEEEHLKEMMTQNSVFTSNFNSDILFASDYEDEDEVEDDDFDEEDEDLFDEDELEEEGYEEDFNFDEDQDEEDDDKDLKKSS